MDIIYVNRRFPFQIAGSLDCITAMIWNSETGNTRLLLYTILSVWISHTFGRHELYYKLYRSWLETLLAVKLCY